MKERQPAPVQSLEMPAQPALGPLAAWILRCRPLQNCDLLVKIRLVRRGTFHEYRQKISVASMATYVVPCGQASCEYWSALPDSSRETGRNPGEPPKTGAVIS